MSELLKFLAMLLIFAIVVSILSWVIMDLPKLREEKKDEEKDKWNG